MSQPGDTDCDVRFGSRGVFLEQVDVPHWSLVERIELNQGFSDADYVYQRLTPF
jgi:hypothetical protein